MSGMAGLRQINDKTNANIIPAKPKNPMADWGVEEPGTEAGRNLVPGIGKKIADVANMKGSEIAESLSEIEPSMGLTQEAEIEGASILPDDTASKINEAQSAKIPAINKQSPGIGGLRAFETPADTAAADKGMGDLRKLEQPAPTPAPVVDGRSTVHGDQKQAPMVQDGPPPVKGMGDMRTMEKPVSRMDKILAELEKEDERGIMDILQAAFAGYAGKESDWSKKQGEKRQQKTDLHKSMVEAELNQAAQMETLAKQYELMGRQAEADALRQAARDKEQQIYALQQIEKKGEVDSKSSAGFMDWAKKALRGQE